MKTREEILATWETEGIYTDWCAIDSYDPIDGTTRRLFVGTENDATDMMKAYYIDAHEIAMQPFYRISFISTSDALAFFKQEVDVLPDERGMYDVSTVAGMLDVSRQRVHQLLQDGKLEGRKVGKTWYVYRYSVEERIAETSPREPFQECDLEAFLGEYYDDYDVEAIIDEATEIDYRTGNRYWKDGIDLNEIAQRHDVSGK